MPAPQQHQQASDWIVRNGPRVLYIILQAWATSVEVFLRRDFGSRYLNTQAAAVLLLVPLVPLYATAWEGHDLQPLFWFLGAYLVMCLLARVGTLWRHLRGEHFHSYYSGYPRLMRLFPKWQERAVKLYAEPAAVCGVAMLIGNDCPPLCLYLFAAAGCLHINHGEAELQLRRRTMNMNDAVIEQQALAEQFRQMRGES